MPTETKSAWICRIQPDTAPAPAISDAGVFFVPKSVVPSATNQQEAEDALRLLTLTDQQKYLPANVTDIQVVDLTSGGGGSNVASIAEAYNPGTQSTPETGADMDGTPFTTNNVILD